jgi:hypothetical protein
MIPANVQETLSKALISKVNSLTPRDLSKSLWASAMNESILSAEGVTVLIKQVINVMEVLDDKSFRDVFRGLALLNHVDVPAEVTESLCHIAKKMLPSASMKSASIVRRALSILDSEN